MIGKGGAIEEWRAGWPLPLVSALAYGVGVAYVFSLGFFIGPLEQEFGWSRAGITSGLTIVSVAAIILGPFVGWLIDRYGPRRIGLPGMLLYCVSIGGLGLAGPSMLSWWIAWTFVALGVAGVQAAIWTSAVASRFNSSRGFAFAVALTGAGLCSSLVPLLADALISSSGWRAAYHLMAVIFAVLTLPLLYVFFLDSSDRAAERMGVRQSRSRSEFPGLTFRAAVRSRYFILSALAVSLFSSTASALLVHYVPILDDLGLDATSAAEVAAVIGIGSIIGRLSTGLLLDRVPAPLVAFVVFLIPVPAIAALLGLGSPPYFVISLLIGLSMGGEVDVMAYLSTRYFGLRSFGAVFGLLIGIQTFATGFGPLLGGLIHDGYGSYDKLLLATMPALALAAICVGSLGRYPEYESPAKIDV